MSRYYTADRRDLVDFLRPHGRFGAVLDIGCAGGRLGRQLLQAGLAECCDGIEPNAAAAIRATDLLHRVWVADLAAIAEQVPGPITIC